MWVVHSLNANRQTLRHGMAVNLFAIHLQRASAALAQSCSGIQPVEDQRVLARRATALLFALLHQPGNLAHWVSLTGTGVAYGWVRVASRSTTAEALMHATYNLALFAVAAF